MINENTKRKTPAPQYSIQRHLVSFDEVSVCKIKICIYIYIYICNRNNKYDTNFNHTSDHNGATTYFNIGSLV
jgi:hypothetical protein